MNEKHIWVGYLTLADKNFLVASDDRVDTGNKKTIFLYNQERKEIVEYSRDIIQAKLKDAPVADYNVDLISSDYKKALRKAKPNLYRTIFEPNAAVKAAPKEKKPAAARNDDSMDDEIDFDDNLDKDDDNDDRGEDGFN